jgi:hypothetical protein
MNVLKEKDAKEYFGIINYLQMETNKQYEIFPELKKPEQLQFYNLEQKQKLIKALFQNYYVFDVVLKNNELPNNYKKDIESKF